MEFRVSQCNSVCELCGDKIPVGHYYAWVRKKHRNAVGNEILKVLRACPKCAQDEAGDLNAK